MTTYILFILFLPFTGDPSYVPTSVATTAVFHSQESCQNALQAIQKSKTNKMAYVACFEDKPK